VPLSMRVTPAVRKKLERAAVKRGRSISQEAEIRLEQSFDREGHLILGYGDIWAYVLIAKGNIWLSLGNDPRDFPEEEHTIVLEIEPEDLKRFRNYFSGAPFPYDYSNKEIEDAGDLWIQQQIDIKRGK
jgi:hypothetical protein